MAGTYQPFDPTRSDRQAPRGSDNHLGEYNHVQADSKGILVLCHAACRSWAGLMVVRFFLGLFERWVRRIMALIGSGVQPCLMTLTVVSDPNGSNASLTSRCTIAGRNTQPSSGAHTPYHPDDSYWYCQQGVQLCVSGLLAYGLTFVQNAPIFPWQALFICVGGKSRCRHD